MGPYSAYFAVWISTAAVSCMTMYVTRSPYFALFMLPCLLTITMLPRRKPIPESEKQKEPDNGPWPVERSFKVIHDKKTNTWWPTWILNVGDKVLITEKFWNELGKGGIFTVSKILPSEAFYQVYQFQEVHYVAEGYGHVMYTVHSKPVTFERPISENEKKAAETIKKDYTELEKFMDKR